MADIKFNRRAVLNNLGDIILTAPYERIGRAIVKDIKTKVRQGISPVDGAPLEPLSFSWSERKDRLAPFQTRLSKFFRSGKSNLTFSGQLLNALTSQADVSPNSVTLSIFTKDNKRRPYRGIKKKFLSLGPNETNRDVQREVEKKRPYLGISNDADRQVNQILTLHIKNSLARLFK